MWVTKRAGRERERGGRGGGGGAGGGVALVQDVGFTAEDGSRITWLGAITEYQKGNRSRVLLTNSILFDLLISLYCWFQSCLERVTLFTRYE